MERKLLFALLAAVALLGGQIITQYPDRVEVCNVKDSKYAGGATGDGVANDTVAIQAAADACAGEVVYFPCSDYAIGDPDSILGGVWLDHTHNDTRFLGASASCVRLLADGSHGGATAGTTGIILVCDKDGDGTCLEPDEGTVTRASGLVFEELTFGDTAPEDNCGAWTASTETCGGPDEGHGLWIQDADKVEIRNVRFWNNGDEGLILNRVDGAQLINVECDGSPGIPTTGGSCINITNGTTNVDMIAGTCHGLRDNAVGTCSGDCPQVGTCVSIESFSDDTMLVTFNGFRTYDNESIDAIRLSDSSHRAVKIKIVNSTLDHEELGWKTHLEQGLTASETGSKLVADAADMNGYTTYENGDCEASSDPYTCCSGADDGTCIPARIEDEEVMITYVDDTHVNITDRGVVGTTASLHRIGSQIVSQFGADPCQNGQTRRCSIMAQGSTGIEGIDILDSTLGGGVRFSGPISHSSIKGTTIQGRAGNGLQVRGEEIDIIGTTIRGFMGSAIELSDTSGFRLKQSVLTANAHEAILIMLGNGVDLSKYEIDDNTIRGRSTSTWGLNLETAGALNNDGTVDGNTWENCCTTLVIDGGARSISGNNIINSGSAVNGAIAIKWDGGLYEDNIFSDTPGEAFWIRGSRNTVSYNKFWRVDEDGDEVAIKEDADVAFNKCDYNESYGQAIIIDNTTPGGSGTPAAGDTAEWPDPGYGMSGTVVGYHGYGCLGNNNPYLCCSGAQTGTCLFILPDDVDVDIIESGIDEVRESPGGGWTLEDVIVNQTATAGGVYECDAPGDTQYTFTSGGHVIEDEGNPVTPQRTTLNMTGPGVLCEDDDPNSDTKCTFSAGGTGSMTTVEWGDSQVGGADIVTLDFDGTVFGVVESPDTEINIDIEDNGIDSDHYAAGSIDAEHLAGDIIDEDKIADNGIDSEHYNDGSIDEAHLDIDGDATDEYVLSYEDDTANFQWKAVADIDTNANTECSGTTTVLDGEGNCDDLAPVYENELDDSAGLIDALDDETGTGVAVFSANPAFTGTVTAETIEVDVLVIPQHATNGGQLELLEGADDGSNWHRLKIPDSGGLTGNKTCTLEADGDIPIDCLGEIIHPTGLAAAKSEPCTTGTLYGETDDLDLCFCFSTVWTCLSFN